MDRLKKPYIFVLNTGYVESQSLASVPFVSSQTFATAKEALIDCGQVLVVKKNFNVDQYQSFVQEACGTDTNGLAELFDGYNKDDRWKPIEFETAFKQSSKVRFIYQAEWVLSAAIGYSHSPDRVTIDTIFARRTEEGGKTFSFWG